MRVLITGVSGFVGQNLSRYFKNHGILYSSISLRNSLTKFQIDDSVDVVIHLAGKAHDLQKGVDENEYFNVNTQLTKELFDKFNISKAEKFIFISSVKAIADTVQGVLYEDDKPNPKTAYGKSKLAAEEYLLKNQHSKKKLYILRPCMIHGPNNKGNLNLLYDLISKGIPYPLGAYTNQRSLLSIDNLCFIINEIIKRQDVPSGVYNVSDEDYFSTIQIVNIIASTLERKVKIIPVPKIIINIIAKLGDIAKIKLNTENLKKLTEDFKVSNDKIRKALGSNLPISGKKGLEITIKSFKN